MLSNKNDSTKCIQRINGVTNERPDLDNHIEEADMRIILQIAKSTESGLKNVVVVSNDTDVCVLLLHYTPQFIKSGLTELWLKYGVGPKVRFIPLHILVARLDQKLDVLLKVHILTGCDATSKIGTKSAALKSDPHMYLKNFGENELLVLDVDAELYLIKVLQSNSTSTTFAELRYELCRKKKKKQKKLYDLPTISRYLQGHLEQSYYVIDESLNLLSRAKSPEPTVYGWESFEADLLPSKREITLPSEYTIVCGCSKGCNGRCNCSKNDVPCTELCQCARNCSDL